MRVNTRYRNSTRGIASNASKYKVHKLRERYNPQMRVYTKYINSTRGIASNASKYKVHKLHQRYILKNQNVPQVEFVYLVFTRLPVESYSRLLRSLLLCLCDVFRALINSLVC